jgi:glycosyltransferase involved in cell wall biosynthesis
MARAASRGILFVAHDASRTGAPIALLHFLRWFKKNGNRPFSVLLPSDGELFPVFAELSETWAIDRSRWCPGGMRRSLLGGIGLGGWARRFEIADIQKFAARCNPGLVYVNSIASAGSIDLLRPRVPVLTHVHELEYLFQVSATPALSRLLVETRRFIACSNAVKENLTQNHEILPERVTTVYESIPVDQVRSDRPRQQVLEELRVPAGGALFIAGGSHNWRKGADLFLQLARIVSKLRSNAYFAWIGGSARDVLEIEHDTRLAGLADKVRFTGSVTKATDYFAAADAFVLTSREDPYPLVCLEAAALGKPIVCFAGAGGMPEFVDEECGFVVPYLDLAAMADRLLTLFDSPERRISLGEAARRKVTERHDISRTAPFILEIIERTLAGSGHAT